MEFDHAVRVKFSPDSKSFITGLGVANTLRAFKISKKDDSSVQIMPAAIQDFPSVICDQYFIVIYLNHYFFLFLET